MLFDRVHNFRDLGGLATVHGIPVRLGRLYRSAAPCGATDADVRALADNLGIRMVLDLRTPEEAATFGAVSPVIGQVIQLPLLDQAEVDGGLEWNRLFDSYADYLSRPAVAARLVQGLTLLASPEALPALVCCSAGKDRTGLIVAAILATVGVPDETIIADYAKSQAQLPAMYAQWATHPSSRISELLRTRPHMLSAPAGEMAALLDFVRREHGSMSAYLLTHGARPADLARLTDTLLDHAGMPGPAPGTIQHQGALARHDTT